MKKARKYYGLLFIALMFVSKGIAQYQFQIWSGGNLGGALYKQNFGFGNGDVNVAGAALSPGISFFSYSNNVCPPAGSYSIVQKVNVNNCSNGKWLLLSSDHNSQLKNGNMMLVHNLANQLPRIVYVDTINEDVCANTMYEFSAAIINVDALASCVPTPDFPAFYFSVEDASGQLIKGNATPGIQAAPKGTTAGPLWKYSIYGFDFTMPSNMNKIVIKISLLGLGSNINCNNDFTIDDILFSPVGPFSEISFDGDPGAIVTGSCFQDNKTIGMNGTVDPFYNNVAYQWQRSSNDGDTWQDINGANSTAYSQNFPVSDTFLFRMRSSDISTISKPGCGVVSNVLKVEVDGIPDSVKVSSNSPVCTGDVIHFNASGGAGYTWSGPNGFYDNVASTNIYNCKLVDSGTYYAEIKTFGGCTAKDSVYVIIKGVRDVIAGPDTSICKGSSVTLSSTEGISYSWTPATGLSSVSIENPVATPDATTTYSVKVESEDGCSDTANVTVRLLNNVAVKSVISGPAFICFPNDTTSFSNNSEGKIVHSAWDFGNGQSSISFNPPPQNYIVDINRIDYPVRLVVTDSAGCADTAYHVMKVESNCYIAVPTAFTPNGDGLNDYLYPLNAYKATNLIFRVYNRQGQLVFQTRDWTKKWDGKVKGELQAEGVYVWTLSYNDSSKKYVSLKGSTMLLR